MESPRSNRQPLATRSNTISRLPLAGSRVKRPRSPDVAKSDGKKSRIDIEVPSLEKIPAKSKSLRTSTSTSTLSKVSSSRTKNAVVEASKQRFRRANSTVSLASKPASDVAAMGPVAYKFRPPQVQKNLASTSLRPRVPQSAVVPKTACVSRTKPEPNKNLNSTVVSTGAPKKRPAWDLKGRLADMENYQQREKQAKSTMQSQLSEYNNRIAQLESQNQQLSGDVVAKEMASESAVKEIHQLKEKLLAEEQEFELKKRRLESQIEDLEFQKSSIARQKVSLEGELAASMQEISGLKNTVAQLTSSQSSIRAQLDNTKIQLDTAFSEISCLKQTISDRDGTVKIQVEKIQNFEMKEREHETERRKLHNTIQELKGNIRVFCRVRPLLGDELLGNDGVISHLNFPDMDGKVLELDKFSDMSVNESMLNNNRGLKSSKYDFNFDKVFQPETSQAEVFEEISQLVQSALDGYNVCIFAYGQTGSGKTHTMEGSLASEETLGMIPRSVQQIFHTASQLEIKGWKYTFKASMLEIYNETIRDLLGKNKNEKHEIRMCGKGDTGEVFVTNLTVVEVTSEAEVLKLLHKSTENRSVAETKCNERSSRSHLVFQLQLIGTNSLTGETGKGTLSLVDLAGSERVKDSGSEGQRLVEAQKINKSLSDLGNVIMALGNKEKHVPYRNSKLTYLLQNSLGGNSKTLMFVNISPKEECFSESLNSLRFATKVNQCNIGTAQKKN